MSIGPDSFAAPRSPLRKAWHFARLLARPALARKLGTLVTEGYLAQTGWVRSVLSGEIVDFDGAPLPWMTRPFIDFIGPRLNSSLHVFEYGSGASTLFFAQRVGQVRSVEHDADFAARLRPRLPANAHVILHAAGSEIYINTITGSEPAPDIVIVDGLERERCAAAAIARMTSDGVLVLDDSQLPEYAAVYTLMRSAGFRALDFWGLAAMRVEHRSTTIFYRNDNVLGI